VTRIRPIERLVIANRGEAAMRCIRTVKALRAREDSSLCAVALYTEIDRDAPFVRHADLALPLDAPRGEAAAYLDHDGLLAALARARADAVWPGWGFVAEDPAFVERVTAAGIRFLGPPAQAMRLLGDKISAKRIAEAAGVPVVAWSDGPLADEADARACAERLGLPVVVKASAGGGGRGIRMVEDAAGIGEACRAAAAEARAAFGDGRLFLERRLAGGRHVEIQIAADEHGCVRALGARDCSVQRRHQKLIEEAPPPGLGAPLVAALSDAAVRLAREVGYVGVGTVEFLVCGDDWRFLEMNPRLQVEHGVTEAITGLDLVELQIRIARGEPIAGLRCEPSGAAVEARVCAEDPDAGFLPAPGRIARFDPVLGPRLRIDSGVTTGSCVPAAFDSLIAKVIASGDDRAEALARLHAALSDFDLVIAGGASNKGFLLDVLESPEFRAGGVDTGWLDRRGAERCAPRAFAVEALVAAAILSYQAARHTARVNFFADTVNIAPSRVPPSLGQQIDLCCGGEQYRLEVYAVGSWRYRVRLDERVVAATLREEGAHTARLEIGARALRVLYDVCESHLRVEVEGRVHRFGRQTAGQVRAGTPAMVVAIHVEPGDRVALGQPLGVLEAMKMEVGFDAPVAGVVSEVRVRRGRQVAAGEVLLVIDPAPAGAAPSGARERLRLLEARDPLEPLFRAGADGDLGAPDLAAADGADHEARRAALDAVREEVRRVLLGYDASAERAAQLAAFLNAPLPETLSDAFRWELAEIRRELCVFADIECLFIRAPSASVEGQLGPSNSARLRMFVRRLRAGGAGIVGEFLALVRAALAHYEVASLEYGDALERAVLRLLATRHTAAPRHQLVHAVLGRVRALAAGGVHLGDDRDLESALARIAGMRGLVSDGVADAAAEASYAIFDRPRSERLAERTSKQLEVWLASAESEPTEPPEEVLLHLADAPAGVFARVARWLGDADPRRRAIAVAAFVRRLHSPDLPLRHRPAPLGGEEFDLVEWPGGRAVLAASCTPGRLAEATERALSLAAEAFASDWPPVEAVELLVPVAEGGQIDALVAPLAGVAAPRASGVEVTLTAVAPDGSCAHRTLVSSAEGLVPRPGLHGIHPETARRIDLDRLAHFELEPLPGGEGIYCFHGRSRDVPADERIFVLADARVRSPDDGREAALHLPAFEHAFYEAARCLRDAIARRDPARRLQWNRIALFVAPAIFLDAEIAQRLARRLAPATRHLGLEKVVVRLSLLDRDAPERAPRAVEFVISDITGSSMEIRQRTPHTERLESRSDYERKVVEARRRRLVYPYEIVRMLTGSGRGPAVAGLGPGVEIPVGRFEEFDLDEAAEWPLARSVAGRHFGRNGCGIVFGIITTPTAKVPEGMSRVLLLSDPTRGMGSLSAPECDRIVAAIDLAERRSLPVEWIPVSSGARIAMDSGTENLDATARVARRIVEFTQAGGTIHVIVHGVNVGAQSYFDALATMLGHTRGALIMTPRGSLVLTGRAALEASGAVSAEDEAAIGGYERVMGPNGEAHYFATDLADAYRILYEHYAYTYRVPGEDGPRRLATRDPSTRSVSDAPCPGENGSGFRSVGEIFDAEYNPDRKRPFPMRAVMAAAIDADGGHLERWGGMVGAETAIVWDAHLGGFPVCLIGIESRNVVREGYRPLDGPESWNAGTLFPLSSKKVARAINAASGNRPVVVLANLSGFDGSPESMRKLQLEHGAEIARAVVNFRGPIVFLVVSRYHGGAYVVFSQALNPELRAAALEGSYASVIGGGPAAAVVFGKEVRARALADPRVAELERELRFRPSAETRERFERTLAEVVAEHQSEVAASFDAIHTVERAQRVGSLSEIVAPAELRAFLVRELATRWGSARGAPISEQGSGT
jgi:acetyl/propionyl-CoA carboxylase alpha subunit/acetyl-CoA carboxylase carboxyltransferase component